MNRIDQLFQTHKDHVLSIYFCAGTPTLEGTAEVIRTLERKGVQMIEIGIPFSDPMADGPVIQHAATQALRNGMTLRKLFGQLEQIRTDVRIPLVLMGYLNPFLQYGLEKLAVEAREAGVHGFIIPDLPFEESGDIRRIFAAQGLALIALVGPNTPEERMRLYADVSEGYVYVVSAMATTGQRARMEMQVAETLQRARSVFRLPLALGFGLEQPEQMQGLPPYTLPDAVVFGSALLKHLDAGKPAAEFMARWK